MKAQRRRGVVLLGLIVLLALLGATAAHFAESAAVARQREREAQLLWVGQQYRQALESYYRTSPGTVRHLPVSLDELVRDTRFPQPVRHLRRLYVDPLQPGVPWGVVKRGSQILGVYSQSGDAPLKRSGFAPGLESFEGAGQYADWRFLFIPRAAPGPALPAPAPARPAVSSASL